ncbi:hypothetical protein LOK49_LG02G03141 [Camellia lanceoleosa]|uniref:Uncharacterized protein n=1 Tax=Camellia lanceoleosa TaxID=1840588 RepID=A0ACC0IMP2_9ERIC|nr:hypothetical protein LOK49_LG02G03141 [Camellia lanceoleosa]
MDPQPPNNENLLTSDPTIETEGTTKLEVSSHKMENHPLSLLLDPGKEAIHLVATVWWIEQIQLRIEPCWNPRAEFSNHSFQMASMRSQDQDHRRIHSILKALVTDPLPNYPTMDSLTVMFWNCLAANNNAFKHNMHKLIKSHHTSIPILMETKVLYSSMGNVFNNMGFMAATIMDPVGRSGGIWLLWDTTQVTIRASHATNQVIQATIHKEDYEEWILSVVYASPNASQWEELWDNLEETANSMEKPWLVAGDFNDFTNSSERKRFSTNYNHNRAQKFAERINNCNRIDLGSVGLRLTWSNNRRGLANTMEHLDGAISNDKLRALFPKGTVRTLPRMYFDHSPLIVLTQVTLLPATVHHCRTRAPTSSPATVQPTSPPATVSPISPPATENSSYFDLSLLQRTPGKCFKLGGYGVMKFITSPDGKDEQIEVNGPIKWTYHEPAANLGWKHHPCNCQSYLVNNLGTIASPKNLNVDITTNGDAYISSDGIHLAADKYDTNLNYKAGKATYVKPLHLWNSYSGKLTDFTTSFSFVIDSDGSSTFGDGLAFFLEPSDSSSSAGTTTGGAIGLQSIYRHWKPLAHLSLWSSIPFRILGIHKASLLLLILVSISTLFSLM